jgi:phosphohistidine phosphatase
MRLYLVQHGEAVAKAVDPERPLSEQGRADVGRLASWMGEQGVEVDRILHSGKTRARQTAELLEGLLKSGGEILQQDGLAPNDPPAAILDTLYNQGEDVLVASHLPLVDRVLGLAIAKDSDQHLADFQPGTVAGIQHNSEGSWRLFMFARPRLA